MVPVLRRRFGTPLPGCRLRPGAYGVAVAAGDLLVVRGPSGRWHLPGGGVEAGETVEAALHREILEETAHRVVHAVPLAVADQYMVIENDEAVLKQCHFFTVNVEPEPGAVADDHFAWVPLAEALAAMAEEASAWAARSAPRA